MSDEPIIITLMPREFPNLVVQKRDCLKDTDAYYLVEEAKQWLRDNVKAPVRVRCGTCFVNMTFDEARDAVLFKTFWM